MADPARRAARRIDKPRAGFFLVRLLKGGPRVPAKITLEFGIYQAFLDGKPCGKTSDDPIKADGVMRIWEFGAEIDRAEYDRRIADPNRPDPHKPYDLDKERSVF